MDYKTESNKRTNKTNKPIDTDKNMKVTREEQMWGG